MALPPLWTGTRRRVSSAAEDGGVGFVAYPEDNPGGRASRPEDDGHRSASEFRSE